jgi:predicted DNA-binding transcriptional regulator YafY
MYAAYTFQGSDIMNNTATRLITLIFLLQNQPNQKASELAGNLGVSLRTVHRYFEMLDEMVLIRLVG